jgi:hypothetical protein
VCFVVNRSLPKTASKLTAYTWHHFTKSVAPILPVPISVRSVCSVGNPFE